MELMWGSRDSVLTSTTTTADAALPRTGGAMTGAITTNSTFDGVDIATRDAVLTATTTTANAALPKAGGTLTGDVTFNTQLGIGAAPHATESLNITNTNQHIRLNNGSELGVIALLSSGELELWGHGANESINFRTGSGSGNIAMNIVGNNVGIGTTAPTATLHVVTPYSEGIRFSDSTGTPYSILQSGSGYAGIGTNSLNNIISWKTNDSLGHVGINTTAPNDKLHIKNGFLRIQAGDQSSGAHTSKYGVRWTQETDVEVARIEVERPAWSGAPSRMNFYTRTPANAVNKTLAIDEYGIVTTPYQPRFKTYLNASTGATTFSASTVHRVPFASEHWDVGNNFNTSDYMFHAPVDGIYLFNVAVLLHSVSTGTSNCEISFRHEDHATYYGQRVDASTGWGDNYVSLNATAHIKLDAGDTVSAKVYCTEAFGIYGNGGGASTYFSGVLEG